MRSYQSVTHSLFMAALLSLTWLLAAYCANAHSADRPDFNSGRHDAIIQSSVPAVNEIITGPSISSRVLGGADSEPGEWPSVVALVRSGTFPLENRLFCGGTIVAERWVMTAAHCLFDVFDNEIQPSSMRVVAGITDLRNDFPDEETIVTNIIVHPQYVNSTNQIIPFDIALLELATSLEQPAATLFTEESEDLTGTLGFIAGWGATMFLDANNSVFPTNLQDATVPLVSNETCNDPRSYDGAVFVNQLCAGFEEGGVDTCIGDSGGPLFIVQNGQQLQIGITGFGAGCALPLFYGIYTNVSHFIPWLSSYIDVPFQAPELIASRQAVVAGDTSGGGSRFFGGALHPFVLLLLGLIPLSRHLTSRFTIRTAPSSVVAILLASAVSSCAFANSPEINDEFLSSEHGRVGVHTDRLGDHYESVLARLKVGYPDLPECVSSVATIRGTGRLSMQVLCSATPSSPEQLSQLNIQKIDYLFLDDYLVRIDAMLVPADSLIGLTDQLNLRYKQQEAMPNILEWRSNDSTADHVRLFTEQEDVGDNTQKVRLQFIDGRLEDRMPSLFATAF